MITLLWAVLDLCLLMVLYIAVAVCWFNSVVVFGSLLC